MRLSTRAGAFVGSVVLAAGAAVGGAGVASALDGSTFTSPSVLAVERDSLGQPVISYDNHSGQDLVCQVVLGSARVVEEIDADLQRYANRWDWFTFLNVLGADPDGEYGWAIEAGQFNLAVFMVGKDHSGPVTTADDLGHELGTDFTLHGLSGCMGEGDPDDFTGTELHVEFENTLVAEISPATAPAATPMFGSGS